MIPSNQNTDIAAANQADLESLRDCLDLMVPMAVELGRTTLTAQKILNLEEQSIIQLARSTGEGVDVIAGGRLIARGEILVIEDRTGVRVNEIVIPEK